VFEVKPVENRLFLAAEVITDNLKEFGSFLQQSSPY
jgi:hypothetical protein